MFSSLCVLLSLLAVGVDDNNAPANVPATQDFQPAETQLEESLNALEVALPQTPAECVANTANQVGLAANAVIEAAVAVNRFDNGVSPENLLGYASAFVRANQRIRALCNSTIEIRTGFAELPADEQRRDAAREFLAVTATMTDLAGRFRYLLFDPDTLDYIEWELVEYPQQYNELLDLFAETNCSVGSSIAAKSLVYPLLGQTTAEDEVAVSADTKSHILRIVAETAPQSELRQLVEFLESDTTTPALVIETAATIRQLGLPQEPASNQDPTLPRPHITPRELNKILRDIPTAALSAAEYQQRAALLSWLDSRIKQGLTEDTYRLGQYEVRPGDWLLMRNPSPYNLFTDLSPGLYTHVGVVAMEQGPDGVRRMVVVDLPERGTHMPSTNVDLFVLRTLDYVFLRDDDQRAANTMGEVAASVIGNPVQFDLNFRSDHIAALKGTPLEDQQIKGYCAGLLLLCAQETDHPREAFFPIPEYPADGRLQDNLATLGLSIGENFVSPTGALFSPRLTVVGRSEPMFDPRREVEQAIYDHFASSLDTRTLTPSSDLYQSLRLRVAQMSSTNSLLSKALARAAGVGSETDLVAAARAAAVVETLDEVAYGASGEFLEARRAILFSDEDVAADGTSQQPANNEQIADLRQRHDDLLQRWNSGDLSPRQLRIELVTYYIDAGKKQLDERFFSDD